MEGKSVALVLLMAAWPCAGQPDAAALMRRMADAEKQNRHDSAYFVYREDIRSTVGTGDGRARQTSWITYEVSYLEGESYHRAVARDDKPLAPAQQELEDKRYREVSEYRRNTSVEERRRRHFAAEENRYRLDTGVVLAHHGFKFLSADKVRGRDVWLVLAQPRRGSPRPRRRSEWSLCQKLKYWIDQETYLPLRIEAEQLRDYDGTRKGALSRVETVEVNGVLLPERIVSAWRRGAGRDQTTTTTDQRYSSYQRFRAEAVLLFAEPHVTPGRF